MTAMLRRTAAAAALVALILAGPAGARAQGPDEIRQALAAGSYEKAIGLALDALRADPANDGIRFLLARAYGYSGRRDEAEATVDELVARHPADTDLLVFKARLLTWRQDLDGAERTFRRALELQPRSADALVGLADLASWRGEYDAALVYGRRTLDLDANHAGALFRIGSVLLWQGDYGRARGYLARAAELEPLNKDFARALAAAVPVYAHRTEVWLLGRNEHWSDGRSDYRDVGLSALFSVLHDRARLVVSAETLSRGDGHDARFGLQAYPQLWKGAYAWVDLNAAPGAGFVPESAVRGEVYQSFLKTFEASLGAGYINPSGSGGGVTVIGASTAAYLGAWYPNIRVQWSDDGARTELTWMAGVRRFLADTSYLWATVGHGTRTFEAASNDEILAGPAWFFEAGFDLYVWKHVKFRGAFCRRSESEGPSSTTLALTTGYRF